MGGGERQVFFSLGPKDRVESLATAGGGCWGWRAAEIQGKAFLDFISPGDRKAIRHALEEVRRGGDAPGSEARFLGKDGSSIPLVCRFASHDQGEVVLGYAREYVPREAEAARAPSMPGGGPRNPQKPERPGTNLGQHLNNLLTGIMGNCDLASLALPPDSPVQGFLDQIKQFSMKAAELSWDDLPRDPGPGRH